MPSKDPINKQQGNEARPFTIFYVNPETPEEVHTDTVMAHNCEEANTVATARYGMNCILHIRGIGDEDHAPAQENTAPCSPEEKPHFPCARFINGEFHSTTFSDDSVLEDLSEQA